MKEKILSRVKEHYDYLVSKGYEVVFTALQGSQNYGLDEYSEEYQSDVDTKSIVLPSFDSFAESKQPTSKIEIMNNNEHAEVKDIRVMFEMFLKENLSYIELLYTDYIVINPIYEKEVKELIEMRNAIVEFNKSQFIKCIAGMSYEKQKALCHPYPSLIQKIEKYGYDGKQLSHCVRLLEFLTRYINGVPVSECYRTRERKLLMNYKKQLDEQGFPLSVSRAKEICDNTVAEIIKLKDKAIAEIEDEKCDRATVSALKQIKIKILKDYFKRELREEE